MDPLKLQAVHNLIITYSCIAIFKDIGDPDHIESLPFAQGILAYGMNIEQT